MNSYCPFCKNPHVNFYIQKYMSGDVTSFEAQIVCPVCKVKFSFFNGAYEHDRLEEYKIRTFELWNKRKPCDMFSEDINTYCECCKMRISLTGMAEDVSRSTETVPVKREVTTKDLMSGSIVSEKDKQSMEKMKSMFGSKKALQKLFKDV